MRGSKRGVNGYVLTQECVEVLESILGWSWEPIDEQWDINYLEIKNLKKQPKLKEPQYDWLSTQRKNYKKNNLSKEKATLLESLPFWYWDYSEFTWNVNFDKFCDCGEETRPLLVQAWADKQRGKYRKGELSTDKIGKLESLPDWRWSFGIKWDEMFQKLKETKCMPNCDGSQLSNWVQAQKARFNQEKLTKDRVQKLENLKFWVWDQTIQQNHKILEKAKSVVTFYKKNKHNPNGNSTNVEEKSLGNFYYRRKAVKAGRSREGVISSEEDQIYINAGLPDWPR